jgi:adhesin transport system membrane fusion protein
VQDIQNLEGGILDKLNVHEGDTVNKDQILLELDDTHFTSKFSEAKIKYHALLAKQARLRAEAH